MSAAGPHADLHEFARTHGDRVVGGGNRPIRLDEPGRAWFVESGALDVFIGEDRNGAEVSNLKHMLRAGPGRLVFGLSGDEEHSLVAIGKGLPESIFRALSLDSVRQADLAGALVDQVDRWIAELTSAVARDVTMHRRPDVVLDLGRPLDLHDGSVLAGRRGVVWLPTRHLSLTFLDTEVPDPHGTGWLPLTQRSWVTAHHAATGITGVATQWLYDASALFASLAEYHRLLLGAEHTNRFLLMVDMINQQRARGDHRTEDEAGARLDLYGTLLARRAAPDAAVPGSGVRAALAIIGRHEGLEFRNPSVRTVRPDAAEPSLHTTLMATGARFRQVRLDPEERWWLGDSGAMLAFRKQDRGCVALVPGAAGRYRVVDPDTGRSQAADAQASEALEDKAWLFYRPLPGERPIGAWRLVRFVTDKLSGDVARLIATGFLSGIMMLAPAVTVGFLVDTAIPAGSASTLISAIAAMIVAALVATLLQMLQGTALMRLEGRMTTRAESGLWDRLLELPQSFFRRFTAGELAIRMTTFQTMRDQLSGAVAGAALSIVFLLPAFYLVFLYDTALGWASFAVGVAGIGGAVVLGLLQLDAQRRMQAAARRLAGDLLAFLDGIHKLRLECAEGSAIASWARKYREQKHAELDVGRFNDHLVAIGAAIPVLAGGMIIALAMVRGGIEVGDFMAAFAAAMILFLAIARLGQSIEAIAAIVPGYEQIEPILEALPETQPAGDVAIDLQGGIRFDHVSFRYSEDGPPILDDVSIQVEPGEFVAVVGESGAGKTTLLQLALGLEEPAVGAVLYDGHNLASLDRRAVRRQIGVVPQDGKLTPGNIGENIIGPWGDLTVEDAWRAAHLAAVGDDIAAMPMQMYTIVGDNEAIFSGGQTQRIRIAAALARRPRIVFLDEATNWLDTESQSRVMQAMENLTVTRIVIAHRLSTIRKADRIYVMQAGRVVQQGGFDELFEIEGPFRRLMLRQAA